MNTTFEIKNLSPKHHLEVLKLNEKLVHFLSPMEQSNLEHLFEQSELFKVVEVDGKVAAFLICIRENKIYDSVNYQWFMRNFEKFLYIDRIVIDPSYHRLGIGRALYNEVIKTAKEEGVYTITAEIDILPENPVSLEFHKNFGFKEVGTQFVAGGKKKVSLQALSVK